MRLVRDTQEPQTVPQFDQIPLWMAMAAFAVAATFVWRAGTTLSRRADALSEKTQLGQAFLGALLLGGATSLPELATTATAASAGNAEIAVNNVLGGIAMQVAILAMADFMLGRKTLTHTPRHPDALLQGALLVLVLALAVVAMVVGERAFLGAGVWSLTIGAAVVASLYLIKIYERKKSWKPADGEDKEPRREENGDVKKSLPRLLTETGAAMGVVLVAGYVLTRSGEAIGEQTGLGSSFAGAVLIATATSLPEVSTTFEAARMGRLVLAFSGIFGTNLFDAGLLLLADFIYPGEPVLGVVGEFAQIAALLGIACTTLYMIGIVERTEIRLGRLGLDSILVLVTYLGGVVLLYGLR